MNLILEVCLFFSVCVCEWEWARECMWQLLPRCVDSCQCY